MALAIGLQSVKHYFIMGGTMYMYVYFMHSNIITNVSSRQQCANLPYVHVCTVHMY